MKNKWLVINTETNRVYQERFSTKKEAKAFILENWLDDEDREAMVIDYEY